MCSNYKAVTDVTRFRQYFEVDRADRPTAPETWPLGLAPFIRLVDGVRVVEDGTFGLLPHLAKELIYGRRTYNARTETVDKLPSLKESWAKSWRCIVPVKIVYEAN